MTVYKQAMRAEATRARREHCGGIFWDLSEYYEHVDRIHLLARCVEHGIPIHIVLPAIRMYQADRILSWQSIDMPVGRSTNGVMACCGHIITFLQASVMTEVDDMLLQWQQIHGAGPAQAGTRRHAMQRYAMQRIVP